MINDSKYDVTHLPKIKSKKYEYFTSTIYECGYCKKTKKQIEIGFIQMTNL